VDTTYINVQNNYKEQITITQEYKRKFQICYNKQSVANISELFNLLEKLKQANV